MSTQLPEAAAETLDRETTLKQLKAKHLLARHTLNVAHDRFIQDMPLNIIVKVFMTDESNHSASTDTARPLMLASVSKAWRSIIFAVPQIWATMRMYRCSSYWNFPRNLVEEWLARSGAVPLRVTLLWTTPLSHDRFLPLQRIGALLQLIQEQSHRLESFHLDVPTAVLSTLTPEATPLLRSFRLAVGEVDVASTNINYSSLTEVTIKDSLDTLETLEFFRLCPNLIRCILCVQNFYTEPTPEELPSSPIILPRLQYFELEPMMQNPGDIVNWINLPRLRHFHLSTGHTRFRGLPYAAMIKRSGCALRSFTYRNDWMDADEEISVLLEAMPTLHNLRLKVNNRISSAPHNLQGPLFSRLVSTPPNDQVAKSERDFLPELRKLLYYGPLPFSWNDYASLCEAHSQQRTSPLWVVIHFYITQCHSAIDQDTRRRLMALPQKTRDTIHFTPETLWEASTSELVG